MYGEAAFLLSLFGHHGTERVVGCAPREDDKMLFGGIL